MKKYIFILIVLLGLASSFFFLHKKTTNVSISNYYDYETTLKQDIFSLMMAYPNYIVDLEVVDNSNVYIILKSGNKLLYDDRLEKNQNEKLSNPSIKDMMKENYILGSIDTLMPQDYNPGRIRVYPLLKEVYGSNQFELEQNLKGIRIGPNSHGFNNNNNAAHHLKLAIDELNYLATNNPELWSYIYPIGGTYNFRYISKTNRLSPHAFGIAIDLASSKDDYWQWATRAAGEKRLKSYPQAIIDVMERNYFIWGGKWGQFDILHFEYRPEIIIKSLYFTKPGKDVWFENLPVENPNVSELICLIEDRLQNFYPPTK